MWLYGFFIASPVICGMFFIFGLFFLFSLSSLSIFSSFWSLERFPPSLDSFLPALLWFGLFNSLVFGWRQHHRCLVGFGLERIVSLGCALDLLCILDLWSLSALGHGKRRRIHGIDLTGGKYNGSDSVGGVGGFPFALAPAFLSRIPSFH